ncbi:MTH1187 family thiamine-binding protein [Rugamonas rubra]
MKPGGGRRAEHVIERFAMVLLEFSMSPMSQGESVSRYVARSLDIIDKSGLPYQLTPMGSIIEGEWAEVMAVVTACFEAMETDCERISTQIKIDYRAGPAGRLKSKVDTVESILGRKLST